MAVHYELELELLLLLVLLLVHLRLHLHLHLHLHLLLFLFLRDKEACLYVSIGYPYLKPHMVLSSHRITILHQQKCLKRTPPPPL
jgi:hypothetical protein